MSKEMWVFALLFIVRWQVGALYPAFTSHLLEGLFSVFLLLAGICYILEKYFKQQAAQDSSSLRLKDSTLYTLAQYVHIQTQGIGVYFIPLLIVFLVRSFVIDTNYIVSGSMKPTLQVGDIALVTKYRYGLRMPLTRTLLVPFKTPERGDIVTFKKPQDHSTYIKRIIGLPGDRIHYKDKQLTINGKMIPQRFLEITQDEEYGPYTVVKSQEQLSNRHYEVYKLLDEPFHALHTSFVQKSEWVVPEGHYFVMGDNRDNSLDSRFWGYVPTHCLVGQAYRIILSFDQKAHWLKPLHWIRWKRISTQVV